MRGVCGVVRLAAVIDAGAVEFDTAGAAGCGMWGGLVSSRMSRPPLLVRPCSAHPVTVPHVAALVSAVTVCVVVVVGVPIVMHACCASSIPCALVCALSMGCVPLGLRSASGLRRRHEERTHAEKGKGRPNEKSSAAVTVVCAVNGINTSRVHR